MPAQTGKGSGLAARYGNKLDQAVQQHAADETNYGIIRLPGGINPGIAQLEQCYFAQYKSGDHEGEYYFRAMGTVISPESVTTRDGLCPVKGMQTSIMHPVCDTRNQAGDVTTQEEHIQDILMEMRRLAGEQYTVGATGRDLEALAAGIQEAHPYFWFSTSLGKASPQYPTPKVFENWHGIKGLESYVEPDPNGGQVDDRTEVTATKVPTNPAQQRASAGPPPTKGPPRGPAPAPSNGRTNVATRPSSAAPIPVKAPPSKPAPQPQAKAPPPKGPPPRKVTTTPPEPDPEPEAPSSDVDQNDLDSLVSRADDQDGEAQQLLKDMGMAAGISEEVVDNAESWQQIANWLSGEEPMPEEATEEEPATETGSEEEDMVTDPKEGDVVSYLHPKDGPVDCDVVKVDKRAGTVNLKSLVNPKVSYNKVKVDQLRVAR